MTQYLLSVYSEAVVPQMTQEQMEKTMADVDAFNAEVMAAGAWVFAGGLKPATSATVVSVRGADTVMTDGPFVEGKEHVGGFWIITADDLDGALAWARKGTAACGAPVEVRPFEDDPEA